MSTPFPSAPMASPVVTAHPAAAPRSAPAAVAAKPAAKATPKRPPLMAQPRVQRGALQGFRVHVVEPVAQTRETIREQLAAWGCALEPDDASARTLARGLAAAPGSVAPLDVASAVAVHPAKVPAKGVGAKAARPRS